MRATGAKPAATPKPAAVVPPKPIDNSKPKEVAVPVMQSTAEIKREVEELAVRAKTADAVNSGKPVPVDWNKMRARIEDMLDDDKWDDGSWGPVFVRLAWHAAGTWCVALPLCARALACLLG